MDSRSADVKAAITKLFPELDAATIGLLYDDASLGWKARPLVPEDVSKEIALVKMSGPRMSGLDQIDPAASLLDLSRA